MSGLSSIVLRAVLGASPCEKWAAFKLIYVYAPPDKDELGRKIIDALRLIESHDQARFDTLSRHMRRIVLTDAFGPEFVPGIRACNLNAHHVRQQNAQQIATSLVHEGCHARQLHGGMTYTPESREFMERECLENEREFARRLPDGAELLDSIDEKAGRPWWSEDALERRRAAELHSTGTPEWLIRSVQFVRRRTR